MLGLLRSTQVPGTSSFCSSCLVFGGMLIALKSGRGRGRGGTYRFSLSSDEL